MDPIPVEPLCCPGYDSLLASVERDERGQPPKNRYREKLRWVLNRARHYSEKTGPSPEAFLDCWERNRTFWYMNYYQDANQPRLDAEHVTVFSTVDDILAAVGRNGFRCPNCQGVSRDPSACDSGLQVEVSAGRTGICNWKSYGLLQGPVFVFCVEKMQGQHIFLPVAWDREPGRKLARAIDVCLTVGGV